MNTTASLLPDLLPTLRALSRSEKLRLIEVLAGELAREEAPLSLEIGVAYEVWSPIDAFEAAALMQRELDKERAKS